MDLIDFAKAATINQGYKYYIANKVSNIKTKELNVFSGYVQDDLEEPYYVIINLDYPKTSYCDCEESNKKICKHMIALYFGVEPEEAFIYGEIVKDYYEDHAHLIDDEYYDI